MWIKAALRNARRPDYEAVTIPFPIPTDQYDSTIKRLEAMDIGDPLVRDCTPGLRTCPPGATTCGSWKMIGISWTPR